MASTCPANVVQAVQWSRDNPTLQGDAAVQAAASANRPQRQIAGRLSPVDGALWVIIRNGCKTGDAFLAQPLDVMDAVKVCPLAQQTGSLKSTPQQTVTSVPKSSASTAVTTTTTTTTSASTPATPSTVGGARNPRIRRWCTCRTITPRRCMAPGPIPLIRRGVFTALRASSLPSVLLKVLVIVCRHHPCVVQQHRLDDDHHHHYDTTTTMMMITIMVVTVINIMAIISTSRQYSQPDIRQTCRAKLMGWHI